MANKYFIETIRSLREKCGYTQEQVANALSLDRSTYTYYETGKTEPSIDSLIKLAKLFQVNVINLLLREEEQALMYSDSKMNRKMANSRPENDSHIYDLTREEKQLMCYFRTMGSDKRKEAMSFMEDLNKTK